MPVGAEVGLRRPVKQVDPVPQRRQALALAQVGHGHAEQVAERVRGLRLRDFCPLDDVGHAAEIPPPARQIGFRAMSCLVMSERWISLVPSPTIISGASRKYRSTSNSVE